MPDCPPAVLPDDRDRLRQQPARHPHALRGDRRRRDRPLAPDDRRRHPLPDRHRRALGEHRHARRRTQGRRHARLRRREGRAVQGGRGRASRSAADRFIRTTDPDHVRAAQEMVRRAYANGDIYLGTYEGWYCPNEGFRNATDVLETARGTICPNHPDVPLQWLTERNWFFRLSAYQERLERHFAGPPGVRPAGLPAQRDARLHPRRASRTSRSAGPVPGWGIPFPIAENGETAQREDGSWDPEAGTIYVWFDALINYITGAGFPDDPAEFARWWPADLHVIGKDIAPLPHDLLAGDAVERRARGAAQGLGPRLAPRRRRRADEQEPRQLPRPGRLRRGVRAATAPATSRSREVPFDKDAEVSWDGFVRRYNADLANDFGNLVNRTVSMANRYLGGERPAPRPATESPLGDAWATGPERSVDGDRRLPAPRGARRALWEFVGEREPVRRRREAVGAGKAGEGRRRGGRRRGSAASSATSSRPAGSSRLAAAPVPARRRRRGCSPSSATRTPTSPTATAVRRSSTSCAGAPTPASPDVDGSRNRSSRASMPKPRHPDRRSSRPPRSAAGGLDDGPRRVQPHRDPVRRPGAGEALLLGRLRLGVPADAGLRGLRPLHGRSGRARRRARQARRVGRPDDPRTTSRVDSIDEAVEEGQGARRHDQRAGKERDPGHGLVRGRHRQRGQRRSRSTKA